MAYKLAFRFREPRTPNKTHSQQKTIAQHNSNPPFNQQTILMNYYSSLGNMGGYYDGITPANVAGATIYQQQQHRNLVSYPAQTILQFPDEYQVS